MMIDFGVAQHIEARATGQPGQRTFHLRILGEAAQSASLKLEKEHLMGLLTGLSEILAQLRYEREPQSGETVYFPPEPDHEVPAGLLRLGYSGADGTVVLEAHEVEPERNQDIVAISVRFRPGQCASLVDQLKEIIGAGRPICPLCGTPVDPEGHVCIKSNGHPRAPIPEEPSDSE